MEPTLLLQMLTDMRTDIAAVRVDVTEIKIWQAERRGERRVGLFLLMTGAGAFGTVLSAMLAVLAKWIKAT